MRKDRSGLFVFIAVAIIIVIGGIATYLLSQQEPDRDGQTLYEVAMENESLTTIVSLIDQTELKDDLDSTDSSYTLFVPSDVALENADLSMYEGEENNEALTEFLQDHIVTGFVVSEGIEDGQEFDTLSDKTLTASVDEDGSIVIGGAEIDTADIDANNGVIHITNDFVDAVVAETDTGE